MHWLGRLCARARAARSLWMGIGSELVCGPAWVGGEILAIAWKINKAAVLYKAWKDRQLPEFIGSYAGSRACHSPFIRMSVGLIRKGMGSTKMATANNLSAGRIEALNKGPVGFQRMVIVYHDAVRAGRHVDIHIGRLSLVKRLPKGFVVSTDANGVLTQATKDRIMTLVAHEFEKDAWLAQNLDHDIKDSRASWIGQDNGPTGYGAGTTRQIVSDEPVYLSPGEHSLRVSAPHLINNRTLTIFKIMERNDNRSVPILALGCSQPEAVRLPDRLHLTLDRSLEAFKSRVAGGRITVKEDGASCYVVRDEKGTRVYSPRVSKKDGKRIEYTSKLPGIELWKGQREIGMGELLFHDSKGVMPAHAIGGVLNGGKLRQDVKWEIALYSGFPEVYEGNHTKGRQVSFPPGVRVVKEVSPRIVDSMKGVEGFVGTPFGGDLSSGRKFKWHGDEHDWKVVQVQLRKGDNGGIAGVIMAENAAGKSYRLGPSAGFSREEALDMMTKPALYEGRVMKVTGYPGHEGRAASFVSWHTDKGVW